METLVVGGAGFIGSHLLKQLKSRDSRTLVIDSLVERIHGTSPKPPSDHFYNVDSRKTANMTEVLRGHKFSEIYFLASDTSTGASLQEIDRHVSQNTTALAGLLKALSTNHQYPERFILTSSRAVYGEGHEIDSLGGIHPLRPRTITELESQLWTANRESNSKFKANLYLNGTNPNNVYGLTKLFQEELLKLWCEANHVKYDIYRLQNVIGPGQNPGNSYSGIITTFCSQAVAGRRLMIYEGGMITRDFVHVDDVAAVLQIPLRSGYTHVDIGTGESIKLLHIAEMISSICHNPEPEITNLFRVGDVCTAYADPHSLQALSGDWRPREIGFEVLREILNFVRRSQK